MVTQRKKKKGVVRRVVEALLALVIAVAVVIAGINAIVILSTKDDVVSVQKASTAHADAIVVLGASVWPDGTPSPILKDRLDGAIELYWAGAAPKIIMSGDNGTASYNESSSMKAYAVAQGVPSSDIFCDYAGFSTYETMYRARNVFGCSNIVVSTQTYHQYRALYIAQGLGMKAVGVATDYREYNNQDHYNLREIAARVKDFGQTIVKPPSKFVGDPISLNQSGDVTNS